MAEGLIFNLNKMRIVNVVASTKLDKRIDIEYLAVHLTNVEYQPDVWAGMVWRRDDPKSTVIMFSTGKITSIGTVSENEAKLAIEKAVKSIEQLRDAHYSEPTIENIVATINLGRRLDLDVLASKLGRCIYEPKHFPGLIHKEEGVTFLIFASGKISTVGGKSEAQVKKAMGDLVSKLES